MWPPSSDLDNMSALDVMKMFYIYIYNRYSTRNSTYKYTHKGISGNRKPFKGKQRRRNSTCLFVVTKRGVAVNVVGLICVSWSRSFLLFARTLCMIIHDYTRFWWPAGFCKKKRQVMQCPEKSSATQSAKNVRLGSIPRRSVTQTALRLFFPKAPAIWVFPKKDILPNPSHEPWAILSTWYLYNTPPIPRQSPHPSHRVYSGHTGPWPWPGGVGRVAGMGHIYIYCIII